MSQENVEIVRKSLEANRSDDIDASIELLDDIWDQNAEYLSVMGAVEPQTYHGGRDGIRRYFNDMAEAWQVWRNEVEDVFDVGPNTVVATFSTHATGKDTGAAVVAQLGAVFVLSDGKIVRGQTYPSRAEALEAVGLSE
jgi:ketosteroid isomerase-like protein